MVVAAGSSEASSGRRAAADPRVTWAAFGAIAALAFVYLLWEGHGNTFFYDEWSWIEVLRSGLRSVLGSYNQHLEVVPLGVYQLLFHTVGISQYWPYRLLSVIGHLACVTAVFAFALRRIGRLALLVAVPMAFFGAGWEFILWGLNFGFTTSIALSVTALIVLERGGRRASAATCALLTVGLLFSETALLFAVGIAVELTWRDRNLRRVWVWAVPMVVYAAWWLAYYQPYLSEHNVGAIPTFGARLAASAAGGLFGLGTHPGWAVLAAVLAALIIRRRTVSPRLVGLAVTALLFWGLVAYGRAELGHPGASKYVYTGSVLLLLIILEGFRGLSETRMTVTIAALLALLSLIGNLRAFGPGEAWLHTGSRTTAAELGALGLARATAQPALVLDPQWAPQVIAAGYFAATRDLGSTPAVAPRRLPDQPGTIRVAVDRTLVRAGEVGVRPVAHPTAQMSRCRRFAPSSAGILFELALPGPGLELSGMGTRTGAAGRTVVLVRRFASVYATPIAALVGARRLIISVVKDTDPRPWQMRILARQPVLACTPQAY